MIKISKNNLHFLWRENYIAYLWATNVTAPIYFLDSGILLFENNVLTVYATSREMRIVNKFTRHLIEKPHEILKLEKEFTKIKNRIREQKKNYTKNCIRNASNKELFKRAENILDMYREFISVYKYTEPHYLQHIECLALEIVSKKIKDKIAAERTLSNILANKTSQNSQKQQFTKEEIGIFKLLQAVAKMRFRAKSIEAPLLKYIDAMLREISKRSFLAENQLSNLSLSDLKDLLLNKAHPEMNLANERQHHFAIEINTRSKVPVRDIRGRRLDCLMKFNRGQFNITTLLGSIGYPGKITGVARLAPQLYGSNQFAKFISTLRQNDILIAPMTSPNITPAFSKVSAVVTDEGGLMSHAALVAREEKIPCIVGTKMATKIFKDGDRLLVDAEKGLVMKISKIK